MNIVDYTEFLVKSICKHPDMVKVSSFDVEDGVILEIIVHEEDKGAVIGRGGYTISAIRTLIRAKSFLLGIEKVRINVDAF